MRLQLSRLGRVEKAVHKATIPPPRAIVVSKFLDGHYEECYTHRPVSQEELDGYDDNDDNFVLILEVDENPPPVVFVKDHGAVHPSPPLSTDEWAERSKAVHDVNMADTDDSGVGIDDNSIHSNEKNPLGEGL